MRRSVTRLLGLILVLSVTSACARNLAGIPTAKDTSRPHRTRTPSPPGSSLATPVAATEGAAPSPASVAPVATAFTATQASTADFCSDRQVPALIDRLKTALVTSDGPLLASLVSPVHGMDTRLFRSGRIVNYDKEHARFLFESTYSLDWGPAPGSGMPTVGSFHGLIVPALLDVLNRPYTPGCNEVKAGGATYEASWPYSGINFYSLYFAGTPANANLDWQTLVLGMDYVGGKPYLYAIMRFQWEP